MIVLVIVVSTGLLSMITYRRAKKSLFSQSEDIYRMAADKYAQELTAWFNANAMVINTIASDIEINGIYEKENDEFHEYLKATYDSLNTDGYIYDIYFTFPDNTMACASDFVADGSVDYVHDREWYTKAAETKELYYSTPYKDSDTHQPIVTISKALYVDGELKGVLAGDIFVDIIVDIINDADVADNSYAFLIDQNMGVVSHPNKDFDFTDKPYGLVQVSGSHYENIVDTIRKGTQETVYLEDYDGVTRGFVVSKMENCNWHVGIATSKAEMMKGLDGLMTAFLIAAIVSVLVGGIIAVFLAYNLNQMNKKQQEYEAHLLKLEKQAADEASEAKSRFLADMSHEIRTPINAILGMNEMIIRETDNREIMGYSRNIRQSGQNLLHLVNSILDFSKIENGKMEVVSARYSLKSQISYVMNSIFERARAKNLTLDLDVDPNLPSELFGDNTRINEVVMNMLTNAVKYTEKGSVTLKVKELERTAEESPSILIHVEVKDTGIGIKQEDMGKLFESFERLDVQRNRNIEGTGLGISVSTKLLALMGSELKVESTYGEGSTFWFDIRQGIENSEPVGEFDVMNADEESNEVYKESFHAPSALILIVDDTKMNLAVAVNFLKKTGVRINTAMSGEESIRLASKNQYDLILMDQRMPGMDGTEAMNKIRVLPEKLNVNTPIICLTADVIRGAKERYIEQGFTDYLTKPIDGKALEKMLLTYIPKDKIVMDEVKSEETSNESDESTVLFEALAKAGVDTKTGMYYCQNEKEMYKAILSEYCLEQKTKSPKLADCFEKRDWKNYEIYIHSLKSTSKTIGAIKLFELAADLEEAAGRGDELAISDGHGHAMDLYGKIVKVIEDHMEIKENDITEEDEIFEFLPEDNDGE